MLQRTERTYGRSEFSYLLKCLYEICFPIVSVAEIVRLHFVLRSNKNNNNSAQLCLGRCRLRPPPYPGWCGMVMDRPTDRDRQKWPDAGRANAKTSTQAARHCYGGAMGYWAGRQDLHSRATLLGLLFPLFVWGQIQSHHPLLHHHLKLFPPLGAYRAAPWGYAPWLGSLSTRYGSAPIVKETSRPDRYAGRPRYTSGQAERCAKIMQNLVPCHYGDAPGSYGSSRVSLWVWIWCSIHRCEAVFLLFLLLRFRLCFWLGAVCEFAAPKNKKGNHSVKKTRAKHYRTQ